jgi:hypothetical protein
VNRQVRLYRHLLRIYPSAFRDEYEAEMTRLFADQLAEARSFGRPIAVALLWVRSTVDVLSTAPGQHMGRERQMAKTVDGPVVEIDAERRVSRIPRVALGLLPLWLFLAHRTAVPAAKDPFFFKPPEVLGLPMGVIALALAFGLMVAGLAVLLRARSRRVAIIGFVLTTVPATALVVLTPSVIVELVRLAA